MGVFRRIHRRVEPDPTFVCNTVLVPKGQSQQQFRFCGNYVEANTMIWKPAAPVPDTHAIIDALLHCTYMTAVDIRSGFQNLKVPPEFQNYTGLFT